MNFIIRKARRYKKISRAKNQHYKHHYAFIGLGSHALDNLYPVLQYLHVPLKYIITRSAHSSGIAQKWFPGSIATSKLDIALNDETVTSYFICADPPQHFSLVVKLLTASKNVFVEKPACRSLPELKEILKTQEQHNARVVIGMQKRYAPAVNKLKSLMRDVKYYTLEYKTGLYPEGNPVTDLFIHPVDLAVYLFGNASVLSHQEISFEGSKTILLHLMHDAGIAGSLELTTAWSWKNAFEKLCVLDESGSYEMINCSKLAFIKKPLDILGFPLEKVLHGHIGRKLYCDFNAFIPTLDNNPVYTGGYYNELVTFLKLCEGKKSISLSSPDHLIPTYSILQTLQP